MVNFKLLFLLQLTTPHTVAANIPHEFTWFYNKYKSKLQIVLLNLWLLLIFSPLYSRLQTQYVVGVERFTPSSFRIIARPLNVEMKVTASGASVAQTTVTARFRSDRTLPYRRCIAGHWKLEAGL